MRYDLQSTAGHLTIRVALFGEVTPERLAVEQAEANRRAYQLSARGERDPVPVFTRPWRDDGGA